MHTRAPGIDLFFFTTIAKKYLHLFQEHYIISNALGVVAQLVRASACHAEGRGFEPRQSRQYLHRRLTVFFLVYYFKLIIYNPNIQNKQRRIL